MIICFVSFLFALFLIFFPFKFQCPSLCANEKQNDARCFVCCQLFLLINSPILQFVNFFFCHSNISVMSHLFIELHALTTTTENERRMKQIQFFFLFLLVFFLNKNFLYFVVVVVDWCDRCFIDLISYFPFDWRN